MRDYGRFKPVLLVLFVLVLGIFSALGQGQSGNNLDRPFLTPFYLLHTIGYQDTEGAFSKVDSWFLCDKKPEDNLLAISSPPEIHLYSIDKTLGPYNTRREVCADANGNTGDRDILWAITLSDGTTAFSLAEPMSCKGVSAPEGPCANACDKSKHLIWDGYEGCNCICEDGYGIAEGIGVTCKPCTDICRSRNNNEIADAANCVGGKCKCICDLEKGYYYNEQGACVTGSETTKDEIVAITNSLKVNNYMDTVLALIPYLENDNKDVRLLAILGIKLAFTRAKEANEFRQPLEWEGLGWEGYVSLWTSWRNDRDLWQIDMPKGR